MTPFQIDNGKPLSSISTYILGSSKPEALDYTLSNREEILTQLRQSSEKSQQQIQRQVNPYRTGYEFKEGDWV